MDIARSGEELIKICEENSISLSEYAIRREMEDRDLSREEVNSSRSKISLLRSKLIAKRIL